MRLGIDFGTTRTVVAAFDRGNYPVVGFITPGGDLLEHYPSVVAEVDGELAYGVVAEAAAAEGAPSLRSFKRLLGDVGPDDPVLVGSLRPTLLTLCTGYLGALRSDLFVRSNLPQGLSDPLEAVVGVPANAHSTQRFVTLEAFRRAGFHVRAVLNEPSAAGVEYAHRHRSTITSRREHVVVYDLGGGTFDAALVAIAGGRHDVVATAGVARLGGDDFDEALLTMALERQGRSDAPAAAERAALLLECRTVKEALNPSSRRLVLELRGRADGEAAAEDPPSVPVIIPVVDYYERVRPLVERSIEALAPVLGTSTGNNGAVQEDELAGIYVVGGASALPVVPRLLRERFGRRVHRSPSPAAATAIGLAIAAADEDAPVMSERFTRHLGVFRESDAGARVSFDGIFRRGTPMPDAGAGPLVSVRTYRAAHNVGHFRFVECSSLDEAGDPRGDITWHAELFFPFAPELRSEAELTGVPIRRLATPGPSIEERYEVDAAGVILVRLTDLDSGYSRRFVL